MVAIDYTTGLTAWQWQYSNTSDYHQPYCWPVSLPWVLLSSDQHMLFIHKVLNSSDTTTVCKELVGLRRSAAGVEQVWSSQPLCSDATGGAPRFNALNVKIDSFAQDITCGLPPLWATTRRRSGRRLMALPAQFCITARSTACWCTRSRGLDHCCCCVVGLLCTASQLCSIPPD